MKDETIDLSGSSVRRKKKKVRKERKERQSRTEMVVGKDSYIIIRHGKKNVLAFAFNPERNRCMIELPNGEDETVEYDDSTLIACLGTKPRIGQTAFGVKIMPTLSTLETPIGPILFKRELEDLEKKALMSALKRTRKAMLTQGIDVFPISQISIMPKKGKWAGMYKYSNRGGEVRDQIDLHPEDLSDRKYNEYILFHEYAHAIWYKKMEIHVRAKWVAAFQSRIEQELHAKDQLVEMRDELIHSGLPIKDFNKELDEEGKVLFKEVMLHYKRIHRLDARSMELLIQERSKRFAKLWPETVTTVKSIVTDISEYAAVSPEEFFAEAFAYSQTGRSLPRDVDKLLRQTVKSLY